MVIRFYQLVLLLMAFAGVATAAAEVEAALDRASVAAGNGAVLTVKVSGSGGDQPVIPVVENLIVQPRGRSQQMQIFNGTTTTTAIYTYIVGSNTPGDYRIPPIEVTLDGKKFATQELPLKVLSAAAGQPPAGLPPAGTEEPVSGENRFGFLTVELANPERSHAYVGEIAPVRIRAWLPDGAQASLRSGIQPEAQGFTLHHVSDQPQQSREMRDGKRYTVVTWFGGISATKAGKLPASLSVDATVAVRDTAAPKQQQRRMGGPFNDPFFDGIFDNTPMVQKDVTLKSEDQEIEVRALPEEGRPEGFAGAVGDFKFDAVEIPRVWKTGEPQQIGARIAGSGNFALLDTPALTPADGWKSYSGKDEFTPGDNASFSGSKAFRFSAVPQKSGERELALTFSFFDPAVAAYKTLTSPAEKIQVTGEDIVAAEPAPAPTVVEPEKKSLGLVGQRKARAPAASLTPLVSRPAFTPLLAGSAGALMLGLILGWIRARRTDPARRALAALEQANRKSLAAAQAATDVPGFFAAARLALQQRLGARWNQPPQAITLAEIEARLPGDSAVARFFREADRQDYDRTGSGEVRAEWRSLLDEAMGSIRNLALLVLLSLSALGGSFEEANGQFRSGDYAAAAAGYEEILARDGPDAAVYYNLGNAWQHLKRYGPAILAYERGRLLAPRDPDLLANLALARKAATAFTDPGAHPRLEAALAYLSRNEWSWLVAAAAMFLGGLSLLAGLVRVPRHFVATAACVAILAIVMGATALYLRRDEDRRGVVLTDGAVVRLSPFETAETLGTAGAGRGVRLGAVTGGFRQVEVSGTLAGWLAEKDVAAISP